MLLASRSARLCTKCRSDLQSLFEVSFCGPKPVTRPRWAAKRRGLTRPTGATSFSTRPANRAEGTQIQGDDGNEISEEDRIYTENQKAALEHLERALGRPIGDAIQEDELHASNEDNGKDEEVITHDIPVIEPEEDLVTAARNAGADSATVAREARQVHGYTLPDGVLDEHEVKVYKRLYGDPEEPEASFEEEDGGDGVSILDSELLDKHGDPVQYDAIEPASRDNRRSRRLRARQQLAAEQAEGAEADDAESTGVSEPDVTAFVPQQGRLQSVVEALGANLVSRDDFQDFYDEDAEDTDTFERSHPLTSLGKFKTSPSTIQLPNKGFVLPLDEVMSTYSNKQLKDTSERTFGGPGLPNSPLTPRIGRNGPQVAVALEASQFAMGEMEANAFMTAVMPPAYAAIMSVLTETRKRLGTTWLNDLLAKDGGPRVLDAGAGGAGILAWNEIVKAHWQSMHDTYDHPPPPASKAVVLAGSSPLRHRGLAMLENTTFVPRLPDYVHTRNTATLDDDRPAQQRKQFDVVIAPYTLLPFKEDWEMRQYVHNLWSLTSSEGGILILLEKGTSRGFEAVAEARETLLQRCIATPPGQSTHYSLHPTAEDTLDQKIESMIIAPCTNHERCPMYKVPGRSRGRKDSCTFQQRYIRPPQLQRLLGARDRNHDDVDFSYLSVMKGRDLRRHDITTFSHIQDSLASTLRSDSTPPPQPTNTEAWLQHSQAGFSDVTPTATDPTSALSSNNVATTASKFPFPATHNLPRLVFPPIKRRGHILLDMCTPMGTIERWTVPRSFGNLAFRDARKSRWGDLWALGAKTRVPRVVKVGGPGSKEEKRLGRGKDGRLKAQAERIHEKMLEREEDEREEMLDQIDAHEEQEVDEDGEMEMPSVVRQAIKRAEKHANAEAQDEIPRQAAVGRKHVPRDSVGEPIDADLVAEWEQQFNEDRQMQSAEKRKSGAGRASKAAKKEQKRRFFEATGQDGKA